MNIKLILICLFFYFANTWANSWCEIFYHSDPLNLITDSNFRQQIQQVIQRDLTMDDLTKITLNLQKLTNLERVAAFTFLKSKYPYLRSADDFSLSPKRSTSHILAVINNPLTYIKKEGTIKGLLTFWSRQRIANSPVKPLDIVKILLKFEELTHYNTEGSEFFMFGSFFNGLATTNSDIDFFVLKNAHTHYSEITQKLTDLGLGSISLSPKMANTSEMFLKEIIPAFLENNRVGVLLKNEKITFFILNTENIIEFFEVPKNALSSLIRHSQ